MSKVFSEKNQVPRGDGALHARRYAPRSKNSQIIPSHDNFMEEVSSPPVVAATTKAGELIVRRLYNSVQLKPGFNGRNDHLYSSP